jgi:NAD(P)-dependent dehydrogenase (short-subunit alcohol dehydrogenase family)
MFDFSDRVVVVTGVSGNLGGAVANAFRDAGAHLVLVDRAPDRLPDLYPDLAGSPDHFLATGVDLNDAEDMARMVDRALDRLGRIDVLANTVGGYRAGSPVHETSLDTWEFMLKLNAHTAFLASRAVVPAMLAQGAGKIVHTASRSALKGGRNAAAYSVSKCAVVRLVESLAAELKGKGINANCVLPGTIDTPENREAMPKADPSKWVPPEAIADVFLFLASDAARAIHGAAIPVYGPVHSASAD